MTDYEGLAHLPFDLDDLPPGWAHAPVGEVVQEVQSGFASGIHNDEGEGVPHLRPMNVGRSGGIELGEVKYVPPGVSDRRLEKGEVLFNNTNSPALVGKTAFFGLDGEWAFSNHMTRLSVGSDISAKFVAAYLHFLWMVGYFGQICTNHVNQASVSATKLRQTVPLVLAPAAEQHRIVDAIEENVTRIDAAGQVLTDARSRLEHLKLLVLDAAFSLDRVEMQPLDELRDPGRPICYGILKPRTEGDLEVPYVEVRTIQDGRVALDDVPRTTRALHEEYKRSELRTGDVLMAVRGSWDRAAVVPPELDGGNVSRDVARISPGEGMNERFLAHYLVSGAARRFFAQHARGVGVQGVNIGDLRQLPVPVVSVEQQRALADDLDARLSAVSVMAEDLQRGSRRVALLKSAVLTAAFSGRLVPQDPDDEPAQVLLDRIAESRRAQRPSAKRERGRVAS